MLEFIRFFFRNLPFFFRRSGISGLSIRDTKEYRKAMEEYLTEHPACEFCGRTKKLEVHHKIPVSVIPDMAADKSNMITLCRKPPCHFVVGHLGNWKNFNEKITEVSASMAGHKLRE